MKVCTKCDKSLPEDEFHLTGKNGKRRADCRRCCNERNKQYYSKHKPLFEGTPPETKWCPQCKKRLPSTEFPKNRRSSTGLGTYCKVCQSSRTKERNESMKGREPADKKFCSRCRRTLDGSLFSRKTNSLDGLYSWCRVCCTAHKYNLTGEQYESLVQKGCYICGSFEQLHVDHDHVCCSGDRSCGACVRGILCGNHNRGTGLFRDNPEHLEAAAAYLRRYAALPIETN